MRTRRLQIERGSRWKLTQSVFSIAGGIRNCALTERMLRDLEKRGLSMSPPSTNFDPEVREGASRLIVFIYDLAASPGLW